jgi:hypothetical protein
MLSTLEHRGVYGALELRDRGRLGCAVIRGGVLIDAEGADIQELQANWRRAVDDYFASND